MKKIEKIILLIAALVYLLAFVDFGTAEPVYTFFFGLTNLVLGVMYLLGGYFLFNLPKKYIWLSVFSGIALALSFIAINFGFRISRQDVVLLSPIPNFILLFGLLVAYIIFKIDLRDFSTFRLLLLRSLIIAIITSFLTYLPVSSKFYRTVMYGLHNGNEYVQYNIKAHDYIFDSEKHNKEKDCDKAILSAEKGLEFGMKWIEKDYNYFNNQVNNFINENDFSTTAKNQFSYSVRWLTGSYSFWEIQGIMTKLFEAYYCKANKELQDKDYQSAISNFKRALTLLELSENKSDYYNSQKAYATSDLAVAYGKIGEFETADLLFSIALEDYEKIENKHEFSKGLILRDWGVLYENYNDHFSASSLFEEALQVFEDNLDDARFFEEMCSIRELLANSYLALGNYKQAELHLNKALSFFGDSRTLQHEKKSYESLIFSKAIYYYMTEAFKESIEVLNLNLTSLDSEINKTDSIKSAHYLLLSRNYLALSDFENTEKSIKIGLKLIPKNTKAEADFLSFYANFNKIKAEYQKAKNNYQETLSIYEGLEDKDRIIPVLLGLSKIEMTISNISESKYFFERAEKLFKKQDYRYSPRNSGIYNLIADLEYNFGNYYESENIYINVINSNKEFHRENSMNSAVAYNGLGLVKFNTKKYSESEELFKKSIKIYEEHFKGENHFLGIVYLNYANLLNQMNQLDKVQEYLSKSERIFKKYFDNSHDNFGDLYLTFGDFHKMKNQSVLAKEYYTKALKVFSEKFDESHHKIELVKHKINSLF